MMTSHPRIGLIASNQTCAAAAASLRHVALLALLLLLLCCASAVAAPSSVHGRVTSHFTGQPFAEAWVVITDAKFGVLEYVDVAADGTYQWSGDCPDSAGTVCNASTYAVSGSVPYGYAIASFANGAQDAVVDLQPHALAHLSGSVRRPASPATYVGQVRTFHYDTASSSWVEVGGVWSDGLQTISGYLAEGRYRVCVGGMAVGLQRQCFDHQPEAGAWSQQTYTDIELAEGELRDGVDFDLVPGGSIAGTLIDVMKGAPLVGVPYNGHWSGLPQDVTVDLFDVDGVRFDHATAYTDQHGRYQVNGLPNGTFRVQLGTSLGAFRDALQVYPGIPCATTPCPVAGGTPVTTHDSYAVSGINMPLHPNVTIRGTVTDAVTHQPLAGVSVAAWYAIPSGWEAPPQFAVYWTQSDAQGNYVAYAPSDWPWGTYVVAGSSTRVSSIHPDAPCPTGAESLCLNPFPWGLPGGGVALAVNAHTGDDVTGIDFALQAGGVFSGFIRDFTDAPLYASFEIYDTSGTPVSGFFGFGYDAFGHPAAYQSPALPPGTYYASATYAYSGPCQAYAGRPCPTQTQSILDVSPTPIVIAAGQDRAGVDFRLPTDRLFADGFGG